MIIATLTHGRLRAVQRFFRTFLEGRKDRGSDWRRHPAVGRLREVSFVSAVKRTMGISPPFAHCHQTQRYRRAPSPALALQPSQLSSHGGALPYEANETCLPREPVMSVTE